MKKKSLFLVLVLAAIISVITLTASAATIVDSGSFIALEWELDSNGTLSITGSGLMPNFFYDFKNGSTAPWADNKKLIKKVEFDDYITNVGAYAFFGCSNITSVHLPEKAKEISCNAFYSCSSLTYVKIPWAVDIIEPRAFAGCTSLANVLIEEGASEICEDAFNGCYNLKTITIPKSVTEIDESAFSGCTKLKILGYSNTYAQTFARQNGFSFELVNNYGGDSGSSNTVTLQSISINHDKLTIEKGKSVSLWLTFTPNNVTNKKVTWSSTDSKVASVSGGSISGTVYASSPGTATITVTASNGKKDTCEVTVVLPKPESISINHTEIDLNVGQETTLLATVLPSSADSSVTWYSSDPSIATVSSNGLVVAKQKGNVVIYAKTCNEKIAECKVNVLVPVTGILLNEKDKKITVGDNFELSANITPNDASNTDVVWKSSDESVVVVDENGNIHGVSEGEATITATTVENGFYDSCRVEVYPKVSGVELNCNKLILTSKKNETLIANVFPSSALNKSVYWKSSDENIVVVDDNGVIKAVGDGTAIITVTTVDGTFSSSCEVDAYTKTIEVSSKPCRSGETVKVDVSVYGNPGVMEMSILIEYNKELFVLSEIQNGELFSYAEIVNTDTIDKIHFKDLSNSNTYKNGLAATLIFNVSDNASLGEHDINVTFMEGDIINADGENENFTVLSNPIVVVESIPGDSNGDGVINMKDSLLLRKHLAGWSVEADESALDVNGDGDVNMKDALLLRKYLAGWDVQLG